MNAAGIDTDGWEDYRHYKGFAKTQTLLLKCMDFCYNRNMDFTILPTKIVYKNAFARGSQEKIGGIAAPSLMERYTVKKHLLITGNSAVLTIF